MRFAVKLRRMTFAEQLRAIRARKNLSQSQAAGVIPGLSVRTLQEWEQEHQAPPDWAQNLILAKLRSTRKRKL